MKMQEQNAVNFLCESEFHFAMAEKKKFYANRGQLNKSKAEIIETESYYILFSYGTPVCVYHKSTQRAFDVLRLVYGYTATSAQHIAKFLDKLSVQEKLIYRAI